MPAAFIPGNKYPSVSITGRMCWLMCGYCEARYLRGMVHAASPEDLYVFAASLRGRGGYGILVSGGFTPDGRLPFHGFAQAIRRIKEELGLLVSIHPGLVSEDDAVLIRDMGVDFVDFEIPTGNKFISRAKGLRGVSVEDYLEAFDILTSTGLMVAPHVMIGAPFSSIDEELDVLGEVLRRNPYIVVLLSYIRTPGTRLEGYPEPGGERLLEVLRWLRERYEGIVSLGCMRSTRIKDEVDPAAVSEGLVDRLANPRRSLIRRLELRVYELCCSIPPGLLKRLKKEKRHGAEGMRG